MEGDSKGRKGLGNAEDREGGRGRCARTSRQTAFFRLIPANL